MLVQNEFASYDLVRKSYENIVYHLRAMLYKYIYGP